VGDGTALNEGVVLGIRAPITLGRDVHVSFHAQIQTGYLESAIIPRVHGASPIAIEDHAWIASGAVVTAGVTVGRGAIVAANSVVVQDVPPMTLVAGAPARVVRPITVDEDPALAAHDRS
jgi:acetyltransferase-like isoleucine patch superfamily enzyme